MAVDLARTFPRRFVPPEADAGDPAQLEPLFRRLLDAQPASAAALERWLEEASELLSVIDEERARRYVAMTSQTDDPSCERAYLTFIERVVPMVKPLAHALDEAYLRSPHRQDLPARYRVLDRRIANRVALFRSENVPLELQEDRLKQQFQKIAGAMTVVFRGREHTLQQMAPYLEEPDRALRQEAWELVARRRLQDRERLEAIFDQLLALRHRLARHAGFEDYRAYAFRRRERFDYAPEDCLRFHEAVEETVLPLWRRLVEERRQALGLDVLRPWDLDVDPRGRPPLRPFETADRLARGVEAVFARLDPELGRQFGFMREQGLLDLESRKGKAPGGYQSTMQERRVPFIFMNAVGVERDLRTLLHEGGHAVHTLASREDPLIDYRDAPLEFCEVASMGMELLATPHLDVFYPSPEDRRRAYREQLERIVGLFPWVATIDAFQHWLYTHPGHARDERREAWLGIFRRFSPGVSFQGYEDAEASLWHRQLHLFQVPFYYIEYGIAQVGALQVWRQARRDQAGAVRRYRAALALGGREPLPVLFAAAGAEFDFSARALQPLMQEVSAELEATDAGG
ncbi:MAG: M3 family oligoendopeptidase [Armatimonadota bacterium]|nr:M3 family oligoendopeptidase [Armatimonadota bacterium]MDR7520130.1 M3 family oligoendopeptidase [Armatimonadota bacterium]MDR7549725.1 M3 family oligoendopeptidase [Armatimonadota bacterium]